MRSTGSFDLCRNKVANFGGGGENGTEKWEGGLY